MEYMSTDFGLIAHAVVLLERGQIDLQKQTVTKAADHRQTDRQTRSSQSQYSILFTVKKYRYSVYPRICCGEFSIFNGTGSIFVCNFVSVNRRNNEAQVHVTVWAWASLFRRFMDTNVGLY